MSDWNAHFAQHGKVFGKDASSILVDALQRWTPAAKHPTALDVGAYYGRNALFLARNGFQVTALDPASDALDALKHEASQANLACETVVGTLETFSWTKKYDLILCANVLHLVRDLPVAIRAMQTHTNSGGVHVIRVWSEKVFDNQENIVTAAQLQGRYAGWTVLRCDEHLAPLAMPTPKRSKGRVVDFVAQKP